VKFKLSHISYKQTGAFSNLVIDYLDRKPALHKFYNNFAYTEGLLAQIKEKKNSFGSEQRELLVSELQSQYAGIVLSKQQEINLKAISERNTFTITTGHQLVLFAGPLYFLYKIAGVINLSKKLKKQNPQYHFVPIFWMATEDHDFAEIASVKVNDQKLTWNRSDIGDAVGRLSTDGILPWVDEISQVLGETQHKQQLVEIFHKAYQTENLAVATRILVQELFAEYGLLCLDGDSKNLKKSIIPIIQADVLENAPIEIIQQSNKMLEEKGYGSQAFTREINFFYLNNKKRLRLSKEGDEYKVVDGGMRFTQVEMETEILNHPERFSPNVNLRPLYQESILPNIAYLGGGAEVAYWFQLKGVFEHFEIPFPVVMLRNSVLIADAKSVRKITKSGFSLKESFLPFDELSALYIDKNSDSEHHFEEEFKKLNKLFEKLANKAGSIDSTLEPHVLAEGRKAEKQLESIQKKVKRALKLKHQTALNQIKFGKDQLFPGNGLQERSVNFSSYFALYGPEFIDYLVQHLDPLSTKFLIAEELE
jgi:bacillithiol biosynthesis cysteine-adding enzyme BshC